MPAPIVGVILAALLVSGVAGAALAVTHTVSGVPCASVSSHVKDATLGEPSYDHQNQTENETVPSNDSGELPDGSGCGSAGSGSDNSPDGGISSVSARSA